MSLTSVHFTVHFTSLIINNFKTQIEIEIYIYILGVARYMYSHRIVTVQASRFGARGLTTNTGNSPPIQKGAPEAM